MPWKKLPRIDCELCGVFVEGFDKDELNIYIRKNPNPIGNNGTVSVPLKKAL